MFSINFLGTLFKNTLTWAQPYMISKIIHLLKIFQYIYPQPIVDEKLQVASDRRTRFMTDNTYKNVLHVSIIHNNGYYTLKIYALCLYDI